MSGKPVKSTAAPDRPGHDAAAAPVGHKDTALAGSAFKCVVLNRLQDRLDTFIVAGCANAVNGLAVCVRGLKLINDRTHFRFLRRVTERFGLKLFYTALFLLERSNRALHRKLLRLQANQRIQKLGDQFLCSDIVGVGIVEHSLNACSDIRGVLAQGCSDLSMARRLSRVSNIQIVSFWCLQKGMKVPRSVTSALGAAMMTRSAGLTSHKGLRGAINDP